MSRQCICFLEKFLISEQFPSQDTVEAVLKTYYNWNRITSPMKGTDTMSLFSFKKPSAEEVPQAEETSLQKSTLGDKAPLYERMVQDLLKESKTSMGFMGKSSIKAAVQILRPNEIPLYAILTNLSMTDPLSAADLNTKSLKDKTNVVLIITDERLLFAGALGKTPLSKALDLTDIVSVDDRDVTSVLHSVLWVETSDTVLAIDGNKQVLTAFCSQLETAIQRAKRRK